MGGYDRRPRQINKILGGCTQVSTGRSFLNYGHLRSEDVLSYRDNPTGIPVSDRDADKYAWFLQADVKHRQKQIQDLIDTGNAFKVSPMQKRNSKIPSRDAYRPHVDNGHPFWATRHDVGTSLRGTSYPYYRSGTPIKMVGGPIHAVSARVANTQYGGMPFHLSTGGTSTSHRTFSPRNLPIPPEEDLTMWGKRAIGTLAPGRPDVNLYSVIGELLTGFPNIIGKSLTNVSTPSTKVVGDEFLNYVFGIQPTVNDFSRLGVALQKATTSVLQLASDQGKGIRRKMVFPVEVKSAVYSHDLLESQGTVHAGADFALNWGGVSTLEGRVHNGGLTSQLVLRQTKEVSFSGSFTYAIPVPQGAMERFHKYAILLDRLIGLGGNAEAAWQLTPWSWLTDWFLDLKTIFRLYDRIQDDNLVINYGYVMCTTKRYVSQHTELTYDPRYKGGFSYVDTWAQTSRKQRVRANPYGFIASTSTEFTPMKWAILAALGMSRTG